MSGKTSFIHWWHLSTGWPAHHSWELHTSSVGPSPLCGVPQSTAGHATGEDWQRRWEQFNTQAPSSSYPQSQSFFLHVLCLGPYPPSPIVSYFPPFPEVSCVLLFLPDPSKVVMDKQEFESPHYQRVYQYLRRHIGNINLDRFSYIGNVEGTTSNCLEIILQWVNPPSTFLSPLHLFLSHLHFHLSLFDQVKVWLSGLEHVK